MTFITFVQKISLRHKNIKLLEFWPTEKYFDSAKFIQY